MKDRLIDLIAELPSAALAPERAHRTRARCHRELDRRASHHRVARPLGWQSWPRALVGRGTMYFAAAVRQALRAYGLR
jgi:hypothetical protein